MPCLILRTDADVQDLLREIREAAKKSRHTGGCYPVYRLDAADQTVLDIQIWLDPAATPHQKVTQESAGSINE